MASWIPSPVQVDGVTIEKTGNGIAVKKSAFFPTVSDETLNRALATEYTNSGGSRLFVVVSFTTASAANHVDALVDAARYARQHVTLNEVERHAFEVPAGSTYEVQLQGGGATNLTLVNWTEVAF